MVGSRDTHTKVTQQSWGGRLGGAVRGTVAAPLLILAGVAMLFWNEGRAVNRHRALVSGAATVVGVAADRNDPAMEGRLVHVSGAAASPNPVTDAALGMRAGALRLRRQVEMYQWAETSRSESRDKAGGGRETVTTYTYERRWSARRLDSGRFAQPAGHQNPAMPIETEVFAATPIRLGAFTLGDTLVGQMDRWEGTPVPAEVATRLDRPQGRRVRISGDGLYVGANPASPTLGDLKVRFEVVRPAVVSVVGRQTGGGIEPYDAGKGGAIALLEFGEVSADRMFETAKAGNRALTWALRVAGFGVIFGGMRALLGLFSAAAAVLPFLGRLVGAGTSLVAFGVSVALSLVVVASGWLAYRPAVGVSLLALAAAAVGALVVRARRRPAAMRVAAGILGLLLGTAAAAQLGSGYAGFPPVKTTARAGEFVLAPSYQSIDKAAGADAAKTTFIFYSQKMIASGSAVSRVAYMAAERDVANSWLVAIPRGGRARVGDIVLTWWQSGSGMQRAIVVGADDPARPVVRYLDLDYENPAKARDKVTPIGQMEEQLAADSFAPLTAGGPGSVHRCLENSQPKRYRLISKAPTGELLLLGHAGKLARFPAAACAPTPLAPALAVGQAVEVEFAGSFTKATIERIDRRIGRAWVKLYGRDDAIAFGDIVPLAR